MGLNQSNIDFCVGTFWLPQSTWQRQQYLISCRHDFYFTSQATQRGKLVRGSLVEEF